MNKYTLGTIVGTALLGLAKSKIGSHSRFKFQYKVGNRCIKYFPIRPIEPASTRLKENCLGDELHLEIIDDIKKSEYFLNLPKQQQQEVYTELFLELANSSHLHCLKNNEGQCLDVPHEDDEAVIQTAKKILKILDMNETGYLFNGEYVSRHHIFIYSIGKKKTGMNLGNRKPRSIIKVPYGWRHPKTLKDYYEENLQSLCQVIPESIKDIGYLHINVHADLQDLIIYQDPQTEAGKRELADKINQRVNEIFNPIGFSAVDSYYYIDPDFYSQKSIVVEHNGEWVPYEPTIKTSRLRKR